MTKEKEIIIPREEHNITQLNDKSLKKLSVCTHDDASLF